MLVGFILTSASACGAALLFAYFKWRKSDAPISAGSVWHDAFKEWVPRGDVPYLTVEMLNGTVWRGRLASFDQDPEDDQRTLALAGPLKRKKPTAPRHQLFFKPAQKPAFVDQDASDRFVLLSELQILSIKVEYYMLNDLST